MPTMPSLSEQARQLAAAAAAATAAARNEATLRHRLENALERSSVALGIPWYPLQLDAVLVTGDRQKRFVDVAHGAIVIEYEAPRRFGGHGGAELDHARAQAEEYAGLLAAEEGRSLEDYTLVAWDGSHISFGRYESKGAAWNHLTAFNPAAAAQLLGFLRDDGTPIIHPALLTAVAGPDSEYGSRLIPAFYRAVSNSLHQPARTTKTRLLFTEWQRLFGQVAGTQSERLRVLLRTQSQTHGQLYEKNPAAYLFSLNTYIALVAKLVMAMSLPNVSENVGDPDVPIKSRIRALEDGTLFRSGGVSNMMAGDFFSWYHDDAHWSDFEARIDGLTAALAGIDFDVSRKSSHATRDLFKEMYQAFVPSALRHALGEYYTPDWLAEHALNAIGWTPTDSLLDPTCGSGTFILEALRRRMLAARPRVSAKALLAGLYGIDLNPLAVLTARASLVVSLAGRLDPARPIELPIFLADAINSAEEVDETYAHRLQTEIGAVAFSVPITIVRSRDFYAIFGRLRELVTANLDCREIVDAIAREFSVVARLSGALRDAFSASVASLVTMHENRWDGIWATILAERFQAAAIPRVSHIAGNPPWVKWSNLPPDYASFIKERCLNLGVFSTDRWVGGIESDISTVITYESVAKWLAVRGKLAFFITGTVFANESSQGFRRFRLTREGLELRVVRVEDFASIAPFEGVTNLPALLIVERDRPTEYPVPYEIWRSERSTFADARDFAKNAAADHLLAAPVPGTDCGPWLKGSVAEHELWAEIFGSVEGGYVARKGITTDRNGIYFVRVKDCANDMCTVENEPEVGRITGIPRVSARVEAEHVFPLLRGRGVRGFWAEPDPDYHLLLPQRGMHGDPELPQRAPGVYRFLKRFETELSGRSSYRRFQKGQPYWSLWSTGSYTFSAWKVVWKEMGGGKFVAAYVGSHADPLVGTKVMIPDHKLYFVPVETEGEAAFLCGVLNAPSVTRAITAFAAQLSLGVSVIEYLKLPRFAATSVHHSDIARIAQRIHERRTAATPGELESLDRMAIEILRSSD